MGEWSSVTNMSKKTNLTRALPSFLYKSAYWDEPNQKPMVFHQSVYTRYSTYGVYHLEIWVLSWHILILGSFIQVSTG